VDSCGSGVKRINRENPEELFHVRFSLNASLFRIRPAHAVEKFGNSNGADAEGFALPAMNQARRITDDLNCLKILIFLLFTNSTDCITILHQNQTYLYKEKGIPQCFAT